MTKEEEAIEYIQKQIDYYKEQIKFIEAVDSDYYDEEYELYKNRIKQFETVLNMLKEKDKLYHKALADLVKADRKNIENEMVIDLMAETIRKLAISLASYKGSYNKETINFTGNIKGIKQYFERKVENGN